jgi:hypothetical protein
MHPLDGRSAVLRGTLPASACGCDILACRLLAVDDEDMDAATATWLAAQGDACTHAHAHASPAGCEAITLTAALRSHGVALTGALRGAATAQRMAPKQASGDPAPTHQADAAAHMHVTPAVAAHHASGKATVFKYVQRTKQLEAWDGVADWLTFRSWKELTERVQAVVSIQVWIYDAPR